MLQDEEAESKMLTRRDILRGIGGWSAANAARILMPSMVSFGLGGCCPADKTLNVILHGLFVMDVTSSGVQLLTPDVDEHIYRAGNWDQDPNQRDTIHDLKKSNSYTLTGVRAARKAPLMNADTNLVLSKSKLNFHVDPEHSYVTINLPFPREVHFLRSMKGTSLYRNIEGSGLALCTILVYQICKELRLGDSGWKPYFYPPSYNVTNLHIWAEPEMRTSPGHARRAYKQLMCLLPGVPAFEPLYDDTPPLDPQELLNTIVPGVKSIHEMGWSEWQNNGEGSRPTNCNTVTTI
jgi:hypothetical protein